MKRLFKKVLLTIGVGSLFFGGITFTYFTINKEMLTLVRAAGSTSNKLIELIHDIEGIFDPDSTADYKLRNNRLEVTTTRRHRTGISKRRADAASRRSQRKFSFRENQNSGRRSRRRINQTNHTGKRLYRERRFLSQQGGRL